MMHTQALTSPQLLSGTVSLAASMMQTVNLGALASRSHRWLRVDEMSVVLYNDPSNAAISTVFNPRGSFMKIRARAYRQDLMLDYVPIWLIGPRVHRSGEFSGENALNSNGNVISSVEVYQWKFPKPFFLPPGSAFSVQVLRDGGAIDVIQTALINVSIAVRAAQIGEAEARAGMEKGRNGSGNPIPFMNAYTPRTFPNKSNNLDLANPFLVPLQLQRMTGRAFGSDTRNGVDWNNRCTVKLADTRTVICEPTQLLSVFPSTQLGWTHTRVLQPAEYITAELTTTSVDAAQPQVAIIGYRNEVLP